MFCMYPSEECMASLSLCQKKFWAWKYPSEVGISLFFYPNEGGVVSLSLS